MDVFGNANEALQVELILRAMLFIFAFLGLGIMFSAGLQTDYMQEGERWKRVILRIAAWSAYALAVVNVLMTITWIIVFFTD